MARTIRADSNQESEIDSQAGPDGYTAGGFEIQTGIARVDEAFVQVDDFGYNAVVTDIIDNNTIVVAVAATDTAAEVAGGTDLSGATFTYQAHRL